VNSRLSHAKPSFQTAQRACHVGLPKLMGMVDGPAEDVAARWARLTSALRKAERELANLSAAVASGDASETLLAAIRERGGRRKEAQAELAVLDEGPQLRKVEAEVRAAGCGEKIFDREGRATYHTPPPYTNNKLTPAEGFRIPEDHLKKTTSCRFRFAPIPTSR